jgi:CheY-like chemotaxis protein
MRQLLSKFSIRGIALSGYGMEEDIRRSHQAGFVEHLTKPVDLAELHGAIHRVMNGKDVTHPSNAR